MVEERKIIMPYGADVAFHCQKCGGFVDEYGKCQFCGSQNQLRYQPKQDVQFYIEVDGEKKFYFNHLISVGAMGLEPTTIDVTMLGDTTSHHISSNPMGGFFDFTFAATPDSMFKTELMQDAKLFTLNVSIKHMKKVFRARCENFRLNMAEKLDVNSTLSFSPRMEVHDIDGWIDASMEAPEGARCPNCGAPIRKTYGLCDYCGGWVEYR